MLSTILHEVTADGQCVFGAVQKDLALQVSHSAWLLTCICESGTLLCRSGLSEGSCEWQEGWCQQAFGGVPCCYPLQLHSSSLGRAGSPWFCPELGAGMGQCLRQLSAGLFIVAGTHCCARSAIWAAAGDSPQMQKEVLGFACVHQDSFPLGKSSSQIFPWTCCILLSARCFWSSLSVIAAQLVLLSSHFLSQCLHSPFSLPWCPAVQPGLEWGVQVSPRLKHIGCSACTSCPPSQPWGGALQVSRRVLQSVFLGLAFEIHQWC